MTRKRKSTRPVVTPPKTPSESGEKLGKPSFPIVGVGASAGGLEAFKQLLHALPVDTGMGFVLVQHLAPTHASNLAEILSRSTRMTVMEVQDESRIRPNHVFVIPPDRNMIISGGTLQLRPRESSGVHRSIDHFFRSLAEDQGHKAIGVILSGTGTDGTLGLEEIKAAGGITFVQNETAQHDSMPRSAIAAGCVDFVLPPDEIAREIARIARHPYVASLIHAADSAGDPYLKKILELLREASEVDFSHYKANTLYRRITRRMALHKMKSLKDYARFLRENPDEVEALHRDILINVTSFFRNAEVFELLKAKIFPQLFKDRSRHDPLRAWVLGCSSGEEAYSIAMTFVEFIESTGSHVPVQIFATDLNGMAIEKARAGVYSKSITNDVSPERLRRFFVEVDGSYRITKPIRDMCVFAKHNVLSDPPFYRVDLISCRNLLIYLEPLLQQKIVPLLHYALKPTGFLVLGSSETIGSYRDLFEIEDAQCKVYGKKPGPSRFTTEPGAGGQPIAAGFGSESHVRRHEVVVDALQKEADRILLTKYVRPGVLINADMEILQFRGDTGPYLAPAPGKASLNLLKMAREGLLVALRGALAKASNEESAVRAEGLRVKSNGGYREVHVEVVPVKVGSSGEGGFLVLFEGAESVDRPRPKTDEPATEREIGSTETQETPAEQRIARLTQELAASREYLQSVIEQQEAANEEVQSANEEVQSANEELQSINEELETSKEEIQSTNEELATVNEESQNRNLELGQINNDLVNLLSSVQTTIVMLGHDLHIRRFTPMAEKMLNLIPTDVGRPISDIKLNLAIPDLETLLVEAIDTVSIKEREVQHRKGRWYSLRIRPYKTLENKIDGAVMMFIDVDTLRRAQEFAENIVETVREPLLVLDADLRVWRANRSFYQTFKVTAAETEKCLIYDLGNGQWNIPELRRLLEEILPHNNSFEDFLVEFDFGRIGRKSMLLNARRLVQHSDGSRWILLAIEDVTGRTLRAGSAP